MTQNSTQPMAEKVLATLVIKPIVFLVRNAKGLQLGEVTLDDETTMLYLQSGQKDKNIIRQHLTDGASNHFNVPCFLSEVL